MAYETYATLKQMLANRLGKTNDATAETLRDNAINDACRQIYHDGRFSWLLKKNAALAVSSGVANLPADFSEDLGFESVFEPTSGQANDKVYLRVSPLDSDLYSTADYVYWVTWDATNKVFVLNTNQTGSQTLTIWYYAQPAAMSGSSDTTPIPDAWAVVDLATAIWWLASERDEDNYDRFYAKYLERLEKMKANDRVYNSGRRSLRSHLDVASSDPRNTVSSVRR
jgi:hypothetical protein